MIRRLNAVLGSILSPEQWNRTFDNLAEDIMETLAFFLFDGDGSSGRVFGGLSVEGSATNLTSVVGRGGAIVYDPATYSPQNYGMALHRTETSVTHTAPDGTHPRYDIISYRIVQSYSATESVKKKDAASLLESIYRYGTFEFVVTAGTPAASPAVPTTPAGYYKLCDVLIPAGVSTPSSWTYADRRAVYSFTQRVAAYFFRDTSYSGANPIIMYFLDYAGEAKGSQSISRTQLWPIWSRDTSGLDTGELATNYMRSTGLTRDYTRRYAWATGIAVTGTADNNITEVLSNYGNGVYTATGASPAAYRSFAIPIDDCDSLISLTIKHDTLDPSDDINYSVGVVNKTTGAVTNLATNTVVTAGSATIDLSATPVYGNTGRVYLLIGVTPANPGDITVHGVDAVYRNGRA